MRSARGSKIGLGSFLTYLALGAIVAGSWMGTTGCMNMPHQTWTPTAGLGSYQEGPNFLVCRGCKDINNNGKLEPEEIQDINPGWVSSGDDLTFVVRNTSSWKLKAQVELRNKENDELAYKSPRATLAANSTWTTSVTAPKNEQQAEYEAIFYVDYEPAHKAVFTVVP